MCIQIASPSYIYSHLMFTLIFFYTGSQSTGFLNALKDSPARYPFTEMHVKCMSVLSVVPILKELIPRYLVIDI